MEGSAFLALLGLCAGMAAGSEEDAIKDFDVSKFAGLWYEISFATKAGAPAKPPEVEKTGGVVLQLENGSLVLTAAYYEDRCVVEKTIATKKVIPGTFTIIREGGKGSKEVQVLSTDYKTYAVMDVRFMTDGVSHQVMKLYTRTLDHNKNALEKFCEVAQEHGFKETDLHLLKHDTACVAVLQGGVPSF